MIQAISKLYSYKSAYANNWLFNVIAHDIYGTAKMYVSYIIYHQSI